MLIREQVGEFVRHHGLASPGERLVVAVSGGADSLCLLDCLDRLGFRVLVAHLDHRLRRDSWRDAEFVLRTARARGLPCVVERLRGEDLRRPGASLEEAARFVRYRFLAETARGWQAARIATGHTADDQVETVLMHFLRGAGVSGLKGMLPLAPLGAWAGAEPDPGMAVIRPLLETTRAQTEAHCAEAGLRPRQDATNRDLSHFRNRLRHRLLPELETYNPGLRQALRRTASVMARQAALVEGLVTRAEASVLSDFGHELRIDRASFARLEPAIQAGLLLTAAGRLAPGLRDFGYEAVELARQRIVEGRRGRRTALPGGLELIDRGDHLALTTGDADPGPIGMPQLDGGGEIELPIPGSVGLAGAGRLVAEPGPAPRDPTTRREPSGLTPLAWFDAERLHEILKVRPPQPGERMQPLGMDGRRKLADIFNSLGIPPPLRARWPVVVSGGAVIWLAGLRMAHPARVTESTRRAVRLQVVGGEERSG